MRGGRCAAPAARARPLRGAGCAPPGAGGGATAVFAGSAGEPHCVACQRIVICQHGATLTHMSNVVGVRELRQNLSRYLDRVKAGEGFIVTERGEEVPV